MLRHQPETELSGLWGGASQDWLELPREVGELWSPSQPEMGTVGKVGRKEVAETGITDKRGA